LDYTKANPRTTWLVISPSQWCPMPSPRSLYVAHVVDKLAPGQVYLKVLLLSCVIPPKEHMIQYHKRMPAEWKESFIWPIFKKGDKFEHNKYMKNTLLNVTYKILSNIILKMLNVYRVSQEKCARLREGVPYVKVYRYNPKHLCPKLNGYGDNGQRKVWSSGGSTHCTYQLTTLSMSILECGFILWQLSSHSL